jgi:Tol biopolymer transport system component
MRPSLPVAFAAGVGGWDPLSALLHASQRSENYAAAFSSYIGFRVATSIPEPSSVVLMVLRGILMMWYSRRIMRLCCRLPRHAFAMCMLSAAFSGSAMASYDLWKINADGSGLTPFAETPGYSCGSPDWSPDGKFVAYDTWKNEETYNESQVAVIRADGTDIRLLGPGAMPSWSPDGKQLVCHTYSRPTTIEVLNADGSGREVVINHWGSPRWSPKGNRIASILRGGIALHDVATGTEQVIFGGQYNVQHGFSVSPDGMRFCFGNRDGGLFVATLDERTMAASVRQLLKKGEIDHTSWAPDGRRVVFCWHPTDEKGQLYVMDVDSNDPPQLLPGQDPNRHNTNADWSPDDKTIIFASGPAVESP